ncbi:MAG: 3-oxoacyl-ACP synthase [Bacteroidales bacterium]|nr:3-oxoacyl-ACP synthase [Bacteroidales bacterium]
MMKILAYCRITNDSLLLNGTPDPVGPVQGAGTERLTAIYRAMELKYPKFHKMDNLSKAGFLASEMVLKSLSYDTETLDESTALVFANSSSSLDNDMRFQATLDKENYFPSPAVFVYTLPNIVTGEIAIRNKIHGETSFFIMKSFNAEKMHIFVECAFACKKITQVLCGWTEYLNGHCDVLVMMVRKDAAKGFDFNISNINKLYFDPYGTHDFRSEKADY